MTLALRSARLAYIGVILLATLTGLDPDLDPSRAGARVVEGLDLTFTARDAVDAARNLVLFAGWGAVWIITGPGSRLGRRILEATLTGAALSATVESLQLFSARRTSSVLDVATNSGGALAGAVFMVALAWVVHRARGKRSFVGIPAFIFAAGYGAAAALEAFSPLFESELLRGSQGGAAARLAHALAAWEWSSLLQLPLLHLLLFAPAGAFAVAALVEAGMPYRGASRRVMGGGALAAVLIELTGGAASHPIVGGNVLVHAAGVAVGAWAAARWLPALSKGLRGRDRPLALFAAYAGVLLLWSWRPFLPEMSGSSFLAQFTLERFTPLAAHSVRYDLFSVVDLLRNFALLFPVGALLAVWPLRRKGPLAGPLPGLYVALLLEVGQLLLAARLFDITDAIVGASAVLIGWAVVRRSGFESYGQLLPPSARAPSSAARSSTTSR